MPAKEIKELRQAGKLEEALNLAKAEMEVEPANIWPKRNISWVYYDYLKQNNSPEHFDSFILWLDEIKNLQLPVEEKILFEQLCWQVGKMAFGLLKNNPQDHHKGIGLFEVIRSFHFPKQSEGYSFLFKALHKSLKETDYYLQFADWWDFNNFMPEDFQKEKMPNGKEVMAIAEQGYIAYAKHLLPKQINSGEILFNKEKASAFLTDLSKIVDNYPQLQYPAYFKAKLLLALGDKNNMLESLLPFAKKKRNDFWVWEILSEAFSNEPEKVCACYCKALSCKSSEEMLVNLRQKMASILIAKKLYNEAKTEVMLLVQARTEHGFKVPKEVENWQAAEWYKNAITLKSNFGFYNEYIPIAESLLFYDVTEELVIVDFVNSDKKMLNFMGSENKFGFFKYDRFLKKVMVGDVLKVRFQSGVNGSIHQLYTVVKVIDMEFSKRFLKTVQGVVKIKKGNQFGFIDNVYLPLSVIMKNNLKDGDEIKALTIKFYNKEKAIWNWKVIELNEIN